MPRKQNKSHPMRVRGLKFYDCVGRGRASLVAPHAGAWIEIRHAGSRVSILWSHPMRVRGLKLATEADSQTQREVAPHAGAWIEIQRLNYQCLAKHVAPHAGAWIEIYTGEVYARETLASHPMRVRGLKWFIGDMSNYAQSRTPCGCVD